VKTINTSGGKTMSDRPYGSFDDVIGAIVGQLNERRGHEAAGVSDPLGVLRAAQERYAAPNPFRPGDVVTPRALTSMKGIGEPHVVLEVGEPRGQPAQDSTSSAFGARFDIAIEELERLIESGRVEGFAQVVVCKTAHPGVFEYKVVSLGLEKQTTFDAFCIGRRSMMEMLGFKDIQGEEGDG
jgi:hypothetical protein